MPISDDERRTPFEQIAAAKGMPIYFTDKQVTTLSNNVHLDLNIVEQVIRDAIIAVDNMLEAITNDITLQNIRDKLVRLSTTGSMYEKVAFAFSRGRYFFPEDVELMSRSALASGSLMTSIHPTNCRTICNFVCNCVCGNDHQCHQVCENVCHEICDVRPV